MKKIEYMPEVLENMDTADKQEGIKARYITIECLKTPIIYNIRHSNNLPVYDIYVNREGGGKYHIIKEALPELLPGLLLKIQQQAGIPTRNIIYIDCL